MNIDLFLKLQRKCLGGIFRFLALFFKTDCMEALGRDYNLSVKFSSVSLPERVSGFEDLAFLFWSSPLNRGLIRMDLDEAAYLYKLVKSLESPLCVEIGRFKGGSTFLIAQALGQGKLVSIDLHRKMMLKSEGASYDEQLRFALRRFKLADKVELAVADSSTYPNADSSVDLIFIDGDHTYEGVKRDYQHWLNAVKPGGHIIFHDACSSRPHATVHEGITRFVREIQETGRVSHLKNTGSLMHFIRK